MFIHLESGACPSNIDNREIVGHLNKLRGPWRNMSTSDSPIITCPSCPRGFPHVSSFLQHIEVRRVMKATAGDEKLFGAC